MARPDKRRNNVDYFLSAIYRDLAKVRRRPQDKALVINVLSERTEGCKVRLQWRIIAPTQTHSADSDAPFISLTSSCCLSQCIRYALVNLPFIRLVQGLGRSGTRRMNAPWSVSRRQIGNMCYRLLQCIAVASSPLRVEEVARFLSPINFEAGPIASRRSDWPPRKPRTHPCHPGAPAW